MNITYDMLEHGREGNNPELIVIHSMGEIIDNTPKDADNDKVYSARDFLDYMEYSAHRFGLPNGDVVVGRSDDQVAFHAAKFNPNSLGYEVLVPGHHNYESFLKTIQTDWCLEAQYESAAQTVREWMNIWNIQLDKVVRHSDIAPGRKVDPGTGFHWEQFKMML